MVPGYSLQNFILIADVNIVLRTLISIILSQTKGLNKGNKFIMGKSIPLFSVVLILTSALILAQPNSENKNKGIFNITSFRAGWLTSGELSRLGAPANQLDVSNARMNSLQTITGFYLNPNYSVGLGFCSLPTSSLGMPHESSRFYLELVEAGASGIHSEGSPSERGYQLICEVY